MRGATNLYAFLAQINLDFNPRFPCGERHKGFTQGSVTLISIHASHAGSDQRLKRLEEDREISIHASHAGSDGGRFSGRRDTHDFNPRFPCGERLAVAIVAAVMIVFQSTLPMRGATPFCAYRRYELLISIHASHAGSD